MTTPSLVEVAPERLAGWVGRFASAHGDVTWSLDPGTSPSSCLGSAADGSWARLTGWGDAGEGPGGPTDVALPGSGERFHLPAPPALLVVLVRRGGYAVAVASSSGEVLTSKVGTRHVQSRTAAGGWSQQRYARRRANQADALVGAVAGHAARVLAEGEAGARAAARSAGRAADGSVGPSAAQPVPHHVGGLVLGGDHTLADEVLQELATGPLTRLHGIPRRELWDVPDPRRSVLDDAVRRGRAVRVEVVNAPSRS